MSRKVGLCVIESHPVQYHAPVYREVQQHFGIPVTTIYGSDFSIRGYHDREFGARFAWDTDLVSGYEPVFLDTSRATSYEQVTTTGLAAELARIDPAVILTVGYGARFDREALRLARRSGRPLMFRGETTDHARKRSRVKALARDVWLRRFYAQFTRLLYVGERSLAHFRRLQVSDQRLVFSPYCVDLTTFAPTEEDRGALREPARARLGAGPRDFVIVFSGKLVERKDPKTIVAAARRLPTELRERVVLCFMGDGELRDEVARACAEAPAIRAQFPGFVPQRGMSAYYHAADLTVLPSVRDETWGLVVNESLAHGVPAIVSASVGCAPDLVIPGDTGTIFAPGDTADLAAAILRVLPMAGTDRVREQCRNRVSRYSVRAAAEGIAEAFRASILHPPSRSES